MRKYTIDVSDEQHILVNMISNSLYLKSVAAFGHSKYFETPYARIVAGWVFEYFEKLAKAPSKDIKDIYQRRKNEVRDEEDLELLGDFLKSLDKYYSKCEINNLEYEIQKAEQYFKLRSLDQLSDSLSLAVETLNPLKGEKAILDYKRIEQPSGSEVSLFQDAASVRAAFDVSEERMYRLPGVLGKTLGYFNRGDFVGVLAPIKVGKTFWLWEIARYGALQGFNVVFFSLEMSKNQMLRRAWQSFVGQPMQPESLSVPIFKEGDEKGSWTIQSEKRKYKGIQLDDISEKQSFYRSRTRGDIRIGTFASGHATMDTLESHLANLEGYDNFVPDVIVVDYADIIKSTGRDYRHNLNDIWVRLRGWAQERNCLVATASQTSKQAFSRDSKLGDVAEDMRKLAHVSKLFSLNQTKEEKEAGILRVNPLLAREGKMRYDQICVLESRDIGRIYLDSRLKKDVVDFQKGERFGESF